MKKTILSTAFALSALAFTSCLSSDGENKSEATLTYGGSQCFNYVTDRQTGESFISTAPQYSFHLNYTDQLITPSMSNIQIAEDGSGLQFKLPTFKVNVGTQNDDYSYGCSGSDIIPENAAQAYVFNNFSFKAIDRALRTANGNYIYSPVYNISFMLNGRYSVTAMPMRYDLPGVTTSTATAGEAKPYSTKQPIYTITLDLKTKKATFAITDAQFDTGHSYMNIATSDPIPFEVSASGITFASEPGQQIQLKDMTGKVEGAYFSDIEGRINLPSSRASSISFHVNINGLQGTSTSTEYDVTADVSYYVPTT